MNNKSLVDMIKHIWKTRYWYSDGNWYLSWHTALWIRIKATICLLFGWWEDEHYYTGDWFILDRYNHSQWVGEYGTHRGWDELLVKVRGWGITESEDGTP